MSQIAAEEPSSIFRQGPAAARPQIFVAVPCYNPQGLTQWHKLGGWVDRLRQLSRHVAVDVWVFDDGSPDWVDPPSELAGKITLERFPVNRGKGAVLRHAVSRMPPDCAVFAFTDFDLPYAPASLIELCAAVLTGADVCIGDRSQQRRSKAARPSSERASRELGHHLFKFFVRTMVVGGVRDSQCGIKAFDARLVRHIAACARVDGFAFDIEWIYIALSHGVCLRYWPVSVDPEHADSSLRGFLSWSMLREFSRFLIDIRRGVYHASGLDRWMHQRLAQIAKQLTIE